VKTPRADRRIIRALETLILLAFVSGVVWVALTEAAPSARALGQEPQAPPETPTTSAPAVDGAPGATEDAVARTFLQKCAGCHTVGRGKLTGPDLNDAATFPMPDLTRAIKSMEKKVGPLSDTDVATLADLLKDPKVRERIKAEEERTAKAAAALLGPPSAETGAALFSGREPLENGGAACASCHVVRGSGGTLGPDLTGVYAKLGEAPLASACEKASFKIMSAAYRDHPVTKQEALHLTRFFATVAEPHVGRPDPPVALYGAAAAVVGLGALALAYRKRAPGVRKNLSRRRS
jgi:mono/diheme cytochrome c family protein